MKILFNPSHYLFDEFQYGSELSSTFELIDRLCKLYPDSVVITGCKNITKIYKSEKSPST